MTAERTPWWPGLSIRARLTVATTAVVLVALTAGALLLVVLVRSLLLRGLDDAARQQAHDIAALIDSGQLPDPVPATSGGVVQVVDAQGRVRAASPGGDRLSPLLEPGPLAAARAGRTVGLAGTRLGVDDQLRVVGVQAGPSSDRLTVLVAVSTTDVLRGVRAVQLILLVGVPLLTAGFAGLAWVLVGSALRPVAALSRGAEEITGTGAAALLPVPQADDEVRRLALTLNSMLERVRAAAARQRSFTSDAAHELRSPLASVRTGLEVALLDPAGADWERVASGALSDTERMGRLVDDLLLLARMDEGAGAADDQQTRGCDLAAVVDGVLDRPAGRVPVRRTGAACAPVAAPSAVATRIVTNLVDNALRHATNGVDVGLSAAEGTVTLTVTDDGPGIAAADREQVFERFTRLDDARSRDEGGSGLGLAIVADLVRSVGGAVRLTDPAGGGPGLSAVVRLPAGPPAG
jgi:signal transduction histidine kinase